MSTETEPTPPSSGYRIPRGPLVKLALVGTALVFISCATLLIWRGVTTDVPDAMFTMIANRAWQGDVASVDGVSLVGPHTALFDESSKYRISFHLPPGNYTYSVRRNQKVLYAGEVQLTRRQNIVMLTLPDSPDKVAPPATRPEWPFTARFDPGR